MVPALTARSLAATLIAFAAACAAPAPKTSAPTNGLRVCVQDESLIEAYAKHFGTAVAAEPRGGRDCDVVARGDRLNAGKVIVRSAFDGSVLAEIEGPVEFAPQLAAFALAPGTEARERVAAQRKAYGFVP